MTTGNSRADALTKLRREAIRSGIAALEKLGWTDPAGVLRNMLAASPVEQPAAAPIDGQICQHCDCIRPLHDLDCPVAVEGMKPLPAPADERAAFEAALDKRAKSAGFEVGRMTECELDNAWWGWQAARAASANETGAEGADALAHEVWSAAQRAPGEGIEDAVQRIAAILSRPPAMAAEAVDDWRELSRRLYVELFHCDQQMRSTVDEDGEPHWTQSAVVRDVLADAKAALDGAPAQAAEPFGWAQPKGGNYFTRNESSAKRIGGLVPVYTAPQPAQADARIGLTDEQRESVDHAATWLDRSEDLQNKAHAERLRALLQGANHAE